MDNSGIDVIQMSKKNREKLETPGNHIENPAS